MVQLNDRLGRSNQGTQRQYITMGRSVENWIPTLSPQRVSRRRNQSKPTLSGEYILPGERSTDLPIARRGSQSRRDVWRGSGEEIDDGCESKRWFGRPRRWISGDSEDPRPSPAVIPRTSHKTSDVLPAVARGRQTYPVYVVYRDRWPTLRVQGRASPTKKWKGEDTGTYIRSTPPVK
jgi:hypothetical protein